MNIKKRVIKALKNNPPPPIRINLVQEHAMANQPINLTAPIRYAVTDSVVLEVSPPINLSNLLFEVDRYAGGGHAPSTIEGVAANTYTTIAQTLNGACSLFEMPNKWAAVNSLKVFPFAGKGLNAYYNRKHLAFFYDQNKLTKEWFFASSSPDIVAHELGHAILDALRPDLWNAASLEIWAFHEAFGDIAAMLSIMQHPEIIQQILKDTNGDIRKHNLASDVAENFSKILIANGYEAVDGYLRSGINNFKYQDPKTLPQDGTLEELTKEPHSFSRIFFGAIYDLLILFYEDNLQTMSQEDALSLARDTLATYLIKAVKNAPASVRFFESMAKTLLWVDFNYGSKFHERMNQIFSNRNIINYDLFAMSLGDLTGHIMNKGEGLMTVCKSKHEKLCNCSHQLKTLSNNEMSNVNLSILRTDAYIHDNKGRLIDVHKVNEHTAIEAAEDLVNFLQKNEAISDDATTPFEIKDGALCRTLICYCQGNSKQRKGQPEYDRPYKPENNSGCCGGCKQQDKKVIKRKIKRGCFVRYKINS